ncbi:hypothetical protein D9M68_563940 [compost metagenome]
MVAPIQFPTRPGGERVDRIEFDDLHTRGAQGGKEGRWCAQGSGAVADQVDLHAGPLSNDQGRSEALAYFVVIENVAFHVDVIVRGDYRVEHGLVGERPILQQLDPVAGGQWTADDGLLDGQVQVEEVGWPGIGLQARDDGLTSRRR